MLKLEHPIHYKQAVIRQPDTSPDVTGVAPWIEIIWMNLIHNAL